MVFSYVIGVCIVYDKMYAKNVGLSLLGTKGVKYCVQQVAVSNSMVGS